MRDRSEQEKQAEPAALTRTKQGEKSQQEKKEEGEKDEQG